MVTDFLLQWSRQHHPPVEFVRLVGEQWDRRAYELRNQLARNGIPYGFYDVAQGEGRELLEQHNLAPDQLPAVVLLSGEALSNPSLTDLAKAINVQTDYDETPFPGSAADLVIIGAGPAGLSAAVYGASEGLRTVVVEREAIGGQAGMSSRIRNYLGFPIGITGTELAERAYQQAWLFGAEFVFTHSVAGLLSEDGLYHLRLSDGDEIPSRSIILAMGVSYRRLEIPTLDRLIGRGVYYGAAGSEVQAMKDLEVYVVGAGNSAGQAALHLARFASRVTMLVRKDSLEESMSEYLIRELEANRRIQFRYQTQVVDGAGSYRLEQLSLENRQTGKVEIVPAAALFVMIGAVPHTEWLPPEVARDRQGYILTGDDLMRADSGQWPLSRPPMIFETSLPGVFAVGDVRHRSVKRVASAVGEGSVAVSLVHQYLAQ